MAAVILILLVMVQFGLMYLILRVTRIEAGLIVSGWTIAGAASVGLGFLSDLPGLVSIGSIMILPLLFLLCAMVIVGFTVPFVMAALPIRWRYPR